MKQYKNSPLHKRERVRAWVKAFSLIEVIIAASILSVTVFGVYKLIGENSKLINNSSNYLQLNNLFPAFGECINYIQNSGGHDFFSESTGYSSQFNFGNDLNGCQLGTGTGVVIDNISYLLEAEITSANTQYIDWELRIEGEGVGLETQNFKLIN